MLIDTAAGSSTTRRGVDLNGVRHLCRPAILKNGGQVPISAHHKAIFGIAAHLCAVFCPVDEVVAIMGCGLDRSGRTADINAATGHTSDINGLGVQTNRIVVVLGLFWNIGLLLKNGGQFAVFPNREGKRVVGRGATVPLPLLESVAGAGISRYSGILPLFVTAAAAG